MRLIAALSLLLWASAALAHGLLLCVDSDGSTISGTAYYSSGEPAAGLWVEMRRLDRPETVVASANTDPNGRFRFAAATGSQYRITVIGDEGHRVDSEIVANRAQRGRFVEQASDSAADGWTAPPAWVWLAGILAATALPALVVKLGRRQR